MTADLSIRHAVEKDLEALLELYTHLAEGNAPYRLAQARETFARFLRYEGSAIVLGETEELPVASCTVVVVPNLTRGCKPYALIENGDPSVLSWLWIWQSRARFRDASCLETRLLQGHALERVTRS